MQEPTLPVGKLPADLLAQLLQGAPVDDPRVLLGPGIGLDCAVIDAGDRLLVLKSDPITFVARDMGRYLVEINANDIATAGAAPRWLLVTLLLPERRATAALVRQIMDEVYGACRRLGIAVVGGHTEITHGLDQPIAVGALIGEVERERLVTPRGARPGDRLLLTKGVPIEGTSILAREFPQRLAGVLSEEELARAQAFLHRPGISVVRDAGIALDAGRVHAMHDPTEGGLDAALWELAQASGRSLWVDPERIPVPPLAARVCACFGIDPRTTIASGALLLSAAAGDADAIRQALESEGIPCADIGEVSGGAAEVRCGADHELLAWPTRDGIAQVFENAT
ncbi:MAG: AIR synthase family protein [Gammaproteobacteria bacterium]